MDIWVTSNEFLLCLYPGWELLGFKICKVQFVRQSQVDFQGIAPILTLHQNYPLVNLRAKSGIVKFLNFCQFNGSIFFSFSCYAWDWTSLHIFNGHMNFPVFEIPFPVVRPLLQGLVFVLICESSRIFGILIVSQLHYVTKTCSLWHFLKVSFDLQKLLILM